MAAAHKLPRGHRRTLKCKPTAASQRGLRDALSALYGDGPSLTGDDALAERERLRIEADTKFNSQGVLHLLVSDR